MKKYFFYIVLFVVASCKSIPELSFKTPVDTTDKPILIQKKQTFAPEKTGVYLSNQFDGARLNNVIYKNDSTLVLSVIPENQPINNSAYFAFKAWSSSTKNMYFTFQYPKDYKHRYIPKIKKDGVWKEVSKQDVINTDKKNFTFKTVLTKQPVIIAAQEIISSVDTYNWVEKITKGKSYIHQKNVGNSKYGRKIPVLDIYKGDKKNKPIVVLLTRQHPPEVTGFYAYQDFLETILNDSKLSDQFLSKYRVLTFPILNPDGVDMGHWRHNANGIDLNRDWAKYNQKEVRLVASYIYNTSKKDNGKILLGLDFHSTYKDIYYTNKVRKGTTMPTFITDWFTLLENKIPNYKVNEAAGNSTKPVSKGWFLKQFKAVGITYEIGDATPRPRIKEIGKITAEQMMELLLSYKHLY